MVILICGTTHTGKTRLAQKLLEKYGFPYYSIDHLKMGLIRSGKTALTPMDDDELTPYLWSIVREIIETAVENEQDLIIEGCYIPFDWKDSFDEKYLAEIRYICLVMSEEHIRRHYDEIMSFANVIEKRLDDSECTMSFLIEENRKVLDGCKRYKNRYLLIDGDYDVDIRAMKFIEE